MSTLPNLVAGDPVSEEHIRVFEAYLREHDLPVAGARPTDVLMNQAVDWWNALGPESAGAGEADATD